MSNNVELLHKHFVSETLNDIHDESQIIKKGDVVDITNYNVNNCTFTIKSVNNKIQIDENDLRFMHKVEESE